MQKKAFTLTELLIALAIIGAIGALTIPSLMSSVNDKMLEAKYNNVKLQIQQLITDQMLQNKTKDLADTDFSDNDALFNASNLDLSSDDGTWGTDYIAINETTGAKSNVELKLPGGVAEGDESAENKTQNVISLDNNNVKTVTFKNGVLASYYYDSDLSQGYFLLDLNGASGPNVVGKDVLSFKINKNGQIEDTKPITVAKNDGSGNSSGNNSGSGRPGTPGTGTAM